MLKRLAGAVVCFGFVGGMALADSPSLEGDWRNVNLRTGSVIRVEIHGRSVHPYGACEPEACDWGVLMAKSYAEKAYLVSMAPTSLMAEKKTSFSEVRLILSPEAEGRLRVQTFTHFTDNSGRKDYSTTELFQKVTTGIADPF
jgi:hypothetical protein